ncbi:MAG: hypothetical protein ACLRMJ_00945 [Alistipes finegoldii]
MINPGFTFANCWASAVSPSSGCLVSGDIYHGSRSKRWQMVRTATADFARADGRFLRVRAQGRRDSRFKAGSFTLAKGGREILPVVLTVRRRSSKTLLTGAPTDPVCLSPPVRRGRDLN